MSTPATLRVRDISQMVTKGTTPTSIGRSFTRRGVAFIKVETIAPDGRFIVGREAYIDPATHAILRRSQLAQGDILFSIAGALGRCTVVEESWLPANTNQAFAIIRPNLSRNPVDPRYLLWQLRSPAIASRVAEINVQAAQANLSLQQVRDFEIPIVPLPEQRAIAEALSDVDGLIAALEALIAKKRAIKLATMQQLLTGRTRLPGFALVDDYVDTKIGLLPSDWGVSRCNDLCVKIQDGTHFSPPTGGNDYLYVTSKNIRFGSLDLSDVEMISQTEHKKIYARCDTRQGDLLLTKDGANTGNAAINNLDQEISLLSSVAFLRFKPSTYDGHFGLQYVLSEGGQQQIKEMMSGNAITRLTLEKIRQIVFPVPSLSEQRAIAQVLSDMDAEIEALEARVAKTRAIKQGMMQQLLTGRIRLVPPEPEEVPA